MTTTTAIWTEESRRDAAGVQLHLVQGGSGEPLLILHDEIGYMGWQRFHDALAQHYMLYIPHHPGFGKTARLDWIMNMRDLAGWYLEALDDLGLTTSTCWATESGAGWQRKWRSCVRNSSASSWW